MTELSIVVPVYDEVDNILPLYGQLNDVLLHLGYDYELIFIDDGSGDGTQQCLRELAENDPSVKVVLFRKNYGQTAALQAGMQMAVGEVIVTMDGDLQNDPEDIPMMIDKLDQDYDLVHGWRTHRKDHFFRRRLPSRIANWIISTFTGFPIHDLGCTLKVMRREIAQDLELYGEMHRFIPILAHHRGARCIEVATRHHPRRAGKTKYGLGRTLRVVFDLMTVKFILDYIASPMKLFGMFGMACLMTAGFSATAVIAMKWAGQVDMTGNPLLLLTVLSTMVGVQFLSLGLLGEVNSRTYYAAQNKRHYSIRETLNFAEDAGGESIRTDSKSGFPMAVRTRLQRRSA